MKNTNCDKMIIAIIQNDDYHRIVEDLNEHGFFVTVLNSSGGFLKKPNATIMMGLNHEHLDEALELLRRYGQRTEIEYKMATSMETAVCPLAVPPMAVPVRCGGIVLFVLDITHYEHC